MIDLRVEKDFDFKSLEDSSTNPSSENSKEDDSYLNRKGFEPQIVTDEPSTNSTMECTTLWGWTITSTCGIGMSKSQRASIISSPLLNMVAESMVIFRPNTHEGCFRACSTVIPENSPIGVWRNGPPEAVRISLRTDSVGLSSRH